MSTFRVSGRDPGSGEFRVTQITKQEPKESQPPPKQSKQGQPVNAQPLTQRVFPTVAKSYSLPTKASDTQS